MKTRVFEDRKVYMRQNFSMPDLVRFEYGDWNNYHTPVMVQEALEFCLANKPKVIIDCTLGLGGYAQSFMEAGFTGRYIGIDKDEESLRIARDRLAGFADKVSFIHDDFKNIGRILEKAGIYNPDVFIYDLGISLYQLAFAERGFSFLKDGPLDMRMDRYSSLSAYDLVNNLSEKELSYIFKEFGQERFYKRIAHRIAEARRSGVISTTCRLAEVITNALPAGVRHKGTHSVARSFQALRIAVNGELDSLRESLKKSLGLLSSQGRICVVSFHSLEDRIVKQEFLAAKRKGGFRLLTSKPLQPASAEIKANSRARSAKLRVIEKI